MGSTPVPGVVFGVSPDTGLQHLLGEESVFDGTSKTAREDACAHRRVAAINHQRARLLWGGACLKRPAKSTGVWHKRLDKGLNGRRSTEVVPIELEALDFGLAGLAYDDDVVIVGWLARALLAGIDESGAGIFAGLHEPQAHWIALGERPVRCEDLVGGVRVQSDGASSKLN